MKPKSKPYQITGYLHVNDETGRVMLDRQGFSPRGKRSWATTVWTSRDAAQLNCYGGNRVVKVTITGLD